MNQERPGAWPWPIAIITLLVPLIVIGALLDLLHGAALTRGSQSWMGWLLGMLGVGVLYLLGEEAVDWIDRQDSVRDPLPKRIVHLSVLLAAVVVAWLAYVALLSVV